MTYQAENGWESTFNETGVIPGMTSWWEYYGFTRSDWRQDKWQSEAGDEGNVSQLLSYALIRY